MTSRAITLSAVLHMFSLAYAQEVLKGQVVDLETGKPLPFVNISVASSNQGTVSNADGEYTLSIAGFIQEVSVQFSYMGYESLRLPVSELQKVGAVRLKPAIISLRAVTVSDKPVTAESILREVRRRFEQNHPNRPSLQQVFLHKYEKTPFPKSNSITVKESNFVGMDKGTFNELFEMLPEEFNDYRDATFELYQGDKEMKIVPQKGVSLEEGSMETLGKEMEKKLDTFMKDIKMSEQDKDLYYKFRTGIFSFKADQKSNSDSVTFGSDSVNYLVNTNVINAEVQLLLRDYTTIDSKNWEFITDPGKYQYTLEKPTVLNDELVYVISFAPEKNGLFEGKAFISAMTYGVLELDFAFAEGKQAEDFEVLGVAHVMKYRQGRVIFEKEGMGYRLKYLYVHQNEAGEIDRDFSIMKKEKRFLVDKELNEIKLSANLAFDTHSWWELLVMEHKEITEADFEKVQQPSTMKFMKEYAYTPEMWGSTAIAPTTDLKQFKRTE